MTEKLKINNSRDTSIRQEVKIGEARRAVAIRRRQQVRDSNEDELEKED